jgi:hypothetical protein
MEDQSESDKPFGADRFPLKSLASISDLLPATWTVDGAESSSTNMTVIRILHRRLITAALFLAS